MDITETLEDEITFEETVEEETVEEFDPLKRKIFTEQGDPEIDSLYKKYKKGKLDIQPDFQRKFVWDKKKACRLIESVLLGIPLPIIYLFQETNGVISVIDGQQRLTSFFSFIDGKFPDDKDFKLSGLNVFKELNRKSYNELNEELQDKISDYKIRTITFQKESEPGLKFEIFERLNTGSVSLNDQELRNCIYRGPYNNLLKELSQDSDFKFLLGIKDPERRMRDVELVLRFAAFYHATYLNYKPSIKQFLNKEIEKYRYIKNEAAAELKKAFKNSVSIIRSLLGERAFKRFYAGNAGNPNGRWETKKFNASLYDVLMGLFAKEDKNVVFQNLDSIRESLIYLMTSNQKFIDSIELSTSSVQAVTTRFDIWRFELQDIIGINRREDRLFTREFKKILYDKNPTCKICGQYIQDIDDAMVDHVDQYWKGGRTIPDNARLTHRYCNLSRSKND
jgi:hypothetical protein